jgi:hypothetical protein
MDSIEPWKEKSESFKTCEINDPSENFEFKIYVSYPFWKIKAGEAPGSLPSRFNVSKQTEIEFMADKIYPRFTSWVFLINKEDS